MNLPCPKCGATVETKGSTATCGACGATFVTGEVKTTPDAAPPADPLLGTVIGGCRLIERVGAGGMGVVYKAEQLSLRRTVAIKLLPEDLRQDTQIGDRFQREIAILASLAHPNIVHILDGGIAERGAYFIMEYVDGVSLRRILSQGGVNPEEALRIIPQLCDALEYAHERGVVHRDIKPENILIDRTGRVRLLDFGLSRIARTEEPALLTRPTQVFGTFEYMAPEQREASRGVDHRADLYSLGVVLYEMLTGELPIGRFDPPSRRNIEVDVRLDEVVLHALEKSPDRRYQRASDIKGEVERISATPPPVVERSQAVSAAAAAPAGAASTPPPPASGDSPIHARLLGGFGEPARIPTIGAWICFGLLTIVGIHSGEWVILIVMLALLAYAYRRLEEAPCKLNQWIVFGASTLMACIAADDGGGFASAFPGFGIPRVRPWIAAVILMPILVYLTGRLRAEFASMRHAPLWVLLSFVALAGVQSGAFVPALMAGGVILFVAHVLGRGRPIPADAMPPPPPPPPAAPPSAPGARSAAPPAPPAILSRETSQGASPASELPLDRRMGPAAIPVPVSRWAWAAVWVSIAGSILTLVAVGLAFAVRGI